jgi:hypothetical protein
MWTQVAEEVKHIPVTNKSIIMGTVFWDVIL